MRYKESISCGSFIKLPGFKFDLFRSYAQGWKQRTLNTNTCITNHGRNRYSVETWGGGYVEENTIHSAYDITRNVACFLFTFITPRK